MTHYILDRVAPAQHANEGKQRLVLEIGIGDFTRSFEFDAYREIVAPGAPGMARDACVPGTLFARDKLYDGPVMLDQEMRGDAQTPQALKVGVRIVVQGVREEFLYRVAAKFSGRQANRVNHGQRDRFARRPLVIVARWNLGSPVHDAVLAKSPWLLAGTFPDWMCMCTQLPRIGGRFGTG